MLCSSRLRNEVIAWERLQLTSAVMAEPGTRCSNRKRWSDPWVKTNSSNGAKSYSICDDVIRSVKGVNMEKDLVTCEVPFGGAVIFNNLLPHRRFSSLEFLWSLNFAYAQWWLICVCLDLQSGSFCFSLNNLSKDIRWSLDLRWQKTGTPISFYGLKEGVEMREKDGSSVPVDWDKFNAVDRTSQMQRNLGLEVLSCFVLV